MGDTDRIVRAIHSAYTLGLLSLEAQQRVQSVTDLSPSQADIDKAEFCDRLADQLVGRKAEILQSI